MIITEKTTLVTFDEMEIEHLERALRIAHCALQKSLHEGNDQDFGGISRECMDNTNRYIEMALRAIFSVKKTVKDGYLTK